MYLVRFQAGNSCKVSQLVEQMQMSGVEKFVGTIEIQSNSLKIEATKIIRGARKDKLNNMPVFEHGESTQKKRDMTQERLREVGIV